MEHLITLSEVNIYTFFGALFANVIFGFVARDKFQKDYKEFNYPSPVAFILAWGLIGLFLLTYVSSALSCAKSTDSVYCIYTNTITESLDWLLFSNLILNVIWLFTYWYFESRIPSTIVLISLLVVLAISYFEVRKQIPIYYSSSGYIGSYIWLPIYLGWIICALVLSLGSIFSWEFLPMLSLALAALASLILFLSTYDLGTQIPFLILFLFLFIRTQSWLPLFAFVFSLGYFIASVAKA